MCFVWINITSTCIALDVYIGFILNDCCCCCQFIVAAFITPKFNQTIQTNECNLRIQDENHLSKQSQQRPRLELRNSRTHTRLSTESQQPTHIQTHTRTHSSTVEFSQIVNYLPLNYLKLPYNSAIRNVASSDFQQHYGNFHVIKRYFDLFLFDSCFSDFFSLFDRIMWSDHYLTVCLEIMVH